MLLKAEARHEVGKGAARKLRAMGRVPGVVYGKGKGTTLVNLNGREFAKALQTGVGAGRLINLAISEGGGGETTKTVILKELQRDSIGGDLVHVDFQEVSMTEVIAARVPVVLVGEERRVNDGGILEQMLWEVEVQGLPGTIPSRVELQVSGLRIGGSVKVADLKLPEGVRALTHPDETVATVAAPTRAAEEAKPAAPAAEPGAAQAEAAQGPVEKAGAGRKEE